MTPWALVPARSFATAKSRLAHLGAGRAEIARALFDHVLTVLGGASLGGILVATDGDDVARAAAARGAEVLFDVGRPTLAAIIDRGLESLAAHGADAAIVLMSDLPLLTPTDVARVIAALREADLVAAPDRDHLGTNALAVHLATALPTCFGNADSYTRHVAAAGTRGRRVVTLDRDGLGFDLDGPSDLRDLFATLALEPEARIGGEGAVRAERPVGVVDTIERIATIAGVTVHRAKHAVERRPLGGNTTGTAGDAP